MTRHAVSRRTFLKASTAAAFAAPFINPRWAKAGYGEQLNLAVIGVGNRGWDNIQGVKGQNIVALCDVDANYLDAAATHFPAAAKFRDFRRMFDAMAKDIDAVVVSTADHVHAPASAAAMRLGKHVYCEKPLAHTVHEARVLARLAKEHRVATQMGTQIHAESNYRRVVELIRAGAIGPVKEVHVWSNKSWSNGRKSVGAGAPAALDWDLWLGPSKPQPYCDGVHPANWRRFWEWGTGTLGDMACHHMDLAFWALDLRHPTKVWTEGPSPDDVGTPEWLTVHAEHPASNGRGACTVTWYDGVSNRPPLLSQLLRRDGSPVQWGDGNLFVGQKGLLLADYGQYLLLPEDRFEGFTPPAPTISNSIGHYEEWFAACRTGSPTTCNFDYSGALTESVLLGNVAFRASETIEWDAASLRVTNSARADGLIRKDYRAGWEV